MGILSLNLYSVMKSLAFKLILFVFMLLVFTEIQAQNKTPWLLLKLIQNEKGRIQPEVWSGPFFALYKDKQRDYRWRSKNIGVRGYGSLGIFVLYSDFYYEDYLGEHTAFAIPVFEKSQEFRMELGAGIKVPVQIGETGIRFEGEMTSPFERFSPALEIKLGWENKNKRFVFSFGNKIVVEYTSLFNPTIFVGYRIY